MAVSVYRVVVRGEFADLTDDQREALLAEVDDHDILRTAFTEVGTFAYDRRLTWWNLRYEVRLGDDDVDRDAAAIGIERATAQLDAWGLGAKHVRATATDMAEVWAR